MWNEDDPEIVEASQQSLGYFIAYKDMFSTWIHMGSDFQRGQCSYGFVFPLPD